MARINTLQRKKGKEDLSADQLLVRPIRLTGNLLTDYHTRFPDSELENFAQQINQAGAPMLSAHETDETPCGTFYAASVTVMPDGTRYLDTWVYFLNDQEGMKLAADIDAGIVNESSIGFSWSQIICSITKGDYRYSPYMAGREYDVTNPQTGAVTRELCFVWMLGCTIKEGSICYRGAHPNTAVGGNIPMFPTALQTSFFALSGSADMLNILAKADPSPSIPSENGQTKGVLMDMKTLAVLLGLSATAAEPQIMDALKSLQTRDVEKEKVLQAVLSLTGQTSPDAAFGVLTAWKTDSQKLGEATATIAQLEGEKQTRVMEGYRDRGYKEGRFTPAEWDTTFSKLSADALKDFFGVATRQVAQSQTSHTEPQNSSLQYKIETRAAELSKGGMTKLKAYEQAMRELSSDAQAYLSEAQALSK